MAVDILLGQIMGSLPAEIAFSLTSVPWKRFVSAHAFMHAHAAYHLGIQWGQNFHNGHLWGEPTQCAQKKGPGEPHGDEFDTGSLPVFFFFWGGGGTIRSRRSGFVRNGPTS